MQKSLVAIGGTNHGKVVPVIVNEFRIGRDAMCHLRPASTDISRLHCAIVTHPDGRVFLRDYGGNNGTVVNQRFLIGGEYEVKDGDLLEIGPLVFRFHCQGEATSTVSASVTKTSAMSPAQQGVRAPVPPPLPRPILPGLTTISSVPRYHREESALETTPDFLSESNIFSIRGDDGLDDLLMEPHAQQGRRGVDAGPKLVHD